MDNSRGGEARCQVSGVRCQVDFRLRIAGFRFPISDLRPPISASQQAVSPSTTRPCSSSVISSHIGRRTMRRGQVVGHRQGGRRCAVGAMSPWWGWTEQESTEITERNCRLAWIPRFSKGPVLHGDCLLRCLRSLLVPMSRAVNGRELGVGSWEMGVGRSSSSAILPKRMTQATPPVHTLPVPGTTVSPGWSKHCGSGAVPRGRRIRDDMSRSNGSPIIFSARVRRWSAFSTAMLLVWASVRSACMVSRSPARSASGAHIS